MVDVTGGKAVLIAGGYNLDVAGFGMLPKRPAPWTRTFSTEERPMSVRGMLGLGIRSAISGFTREFTVVQNG